MKMDTIKQVFAWSLVIITAMLMSVTLADWANKSKRERCESEGGKFIENETKSQYSSCFYD